MKIAFYIHHSALKAGGIFTYSIGILKLLLASNEIESVYLIHSENQKAYFEENFSIQKLKLVEIKRYSKINKIRFGLAYLLYEWGTLYEEYGVGVTRVLKWLSYGLNPYRQIDKLGVEVLHVPMQYSPIYEAKTPTLVTMHDVQEFHFPENFSSAERIHRAINSQKSLRTANRIIVSFEHVKQDLIKYYKLEADQISVCPPPFHSNWFASSAATKMADLIKEYNLSETFILYPAATWPHKNHRTLLQALNILKKNGSTVKLICTGGKTDHFEQSLLPLISELQLNDDVKFLGIVSEENLNGLYNAAKLVVIPTRYEAGSGPLYEAMRASVPVICAQTTSLPETISDLTFTFDPLDANNLADLIQKGISDKAFRTKNIDNSKKRIGELSQVNYVSNFIEAYESVVK
ncbi:MAG: glycosyltransferase family 4 protein [Cyclobacteriaceae bacterium]